MTRPRIGSRVRTLEGGGAAGPPRARPRRTCSRKPWLVQVGGLRAGSYSNDQLVNLAHPSATSIIPGLQQLEVGGLVRMSPSDRAPERTAFTGHSYCVNDSLSWSKPVSTWAWSLAPTDDGGTRLLTPFRACYDWMHAVAGLSAVVLMELGDFTMLRRMFRGIKARGEAVAIRAADGQANIAR